MSSQEFYIPVAVPVEANSKHLGRLEGIIGIVCAILAIPPIPPIFGIVGIILGWIAKDKGAKTIGIVAVVLSSIFMIIGWFVSIEFILALKKGQGVY